MKYWTLVLLLISINLFASNPECLKLQSKLKGELQNLARRGIQPGSGVYLSKEMEINQKVQQCESEYSTSKQNYQQSNSQPQYQPVIQYKQESLKSHCAKTTKPTMCDNGYQPFSCFSFNGDQLATFVLEDGRCFVTTCECFNYYKE